MATWIVVAALALPLGLAPPFDASPGPSAMLAHWPALVLLLVSAATRAGVDRVRVARSVAPTRGAVRAARTAWLVGLVGTWTWFWCVDLHRARVAALLVAVPAACLLCATIFRRIDAALLGGAAALSGVWAHFVVRSDNGCTGVSSAYETTLLVTAVLLYAAGPWVIPGPRRGRASAEPAAER